jgi:hypothetical protein
VSYADAGRSSVIGNYLAVNVLNITTLLANTMIPKLQDWESTPAPLKQLTIPQE